MRILIRICLVGLGMLAVALIVGFAWLFSSQGIPDSEALSQFAPETARRVSDRCLSASVAVPYDSIGNTMRSALSASGAGEDDPGIISEMFRSVSDHSRPARTGLSLQVSRTLFCQPSRNLNRQIAVLRAAVQLERRFSRRELFTIYANRLVFGENIVGVEAASQHFFHGEPNQLHLEEAALLAGMARAPSYLSPSRHPDLALRRRNEVLDLMVDAHAITQSEASAAKSSPLPTELP
jgi:membrane peptidoglycan carboxypeptidase